MARDTARERDSEQSLLDRRSYLRLAGAAAATVAGASAASSVDAASYDTVTVSSGATETIRLGDGDSLTDTLIDITASGARCHVRADGRDWTIRNVAVRGQEPTGDNFLMHVVGHGECRIENCYFGDGGRGSTGDYTALFVNARHSGDLLVRDCYFANWKDNAIYGSPPGNPNAGIYASKGAEGHGGSVRVENCYFDNNHVSNVRLGTDDSYAKNCVTTNNVHRGFWAYWNNPQFRNCDVTGATTFDAGEPAHKNVWGSPPPTATLVDCRHEGSLRARDGAIIDGRPASNPRTSPPAGVPTTPEEAASGQSGSSPDGSGSTDATTEPRTTDDQRGTLLELVSGANTTDVAYEFTVEGRVSKHTSGSDPLADANDSVTDNGDGTVTVSGTAGNGYGDAFYVEGTITSMDLDESEWTVRYGGREVAPRDLVLPNKLVIDGSGHPRVASEYTFTVSGEAEKSAALGSVNPRDTIANGEISGRVVGGKDGYRFSGEITGFSLDGPATVRVEDGP